ncbi:MAG: sigma-70 family RNA polymerase sigma factor [Clostridiales bacterium]|nr:sigma-70 family RNA polymerase sigma factor [Clostridiales bacterium]
MQKKERKHKVVTASLQDELAEGFSIEDTLQDPYRFEDAVEKRETIRNIMKRASPREKVVLRMTLSGATQTQIGRQIGCSQVSVSKILKKIRERGKVSA